MTYLAKVRKCDLSKLAYEFGEVVLPESRIVDLKHLILNSQSYEEEFAKQLLETLIEDRERIEERERIEDRKRIEDRERIERERKEQMVMEFELEKLRIQTTRGNNDTSRSTSNDAHYEIRKLMPKYESKDNDLSFYLILFERQAKRLGLDEDQWAFSLLGLLPYEMTQLIARETEEQSGDYRFVKRLLLKRYKLSPEQFRQKFEKHERSQKGSWRDFAFELRGYFNEWIEGMNVENFDALKDLSVTNQLKEKVPNVLRNHLIDDWTKLNNPDELADKLDEYENVRTEMGPPHWNAKHLIPPSFQQKSARFPNQSEVKETKQGTNVSGQDAERNEISETDCPAPRTTLTCRGCGQTGHKERNCTRPKEGLKVANLEVEGLETVPPDVYLKDVKIDNKETVKAMIDTGSSSCLMRESVARRISVDIEPNSTSLYGIGNQTAPAARTVGKTTVDLEIDGIVGREITVFIVNDDAQPYDLLIGRTWTDLPYVSFARIGKNLHIGYSSEFPFANLQEEIKSRRIELRATETVQLESDSINFTSAITDEVKDGYVLFTGVDDACVDSLLEVVDGKTTVPIISAGKGKLRVRKNQCVGRVELLNLDDIVVNLDVAEDSFQTKNEEKREGQDQMKRKRPILPEDINVNHSLTSKERQEILDVVNEYRDCFALGMEELGCTDVTKMDIKEVDGSKPVCLRPYKTTASEREAIREIVREWKDNGIVTETRSPYASPVLLVRKKTGDHRLVVDYRRLNIQTVKDKFPLPRIDDLLEGLRNAKFFTTLDLAHGYLQIPLTDKAKLKTAFITPDDTGQFERMIFGLANAPAEFQRLMHTVLGPLLNKKAFCYLDDVIIPAKDWREMIERLREVLERIRSAKLTLKPSKCEFGRREVEFLGYVISTGGLKPGPRKIKAIEEFPEPKNVHDIRRFLGLTNFFRRFVKDFARKAEPLSRLTKKGSQFEWKEEQRRSFGGLRKDLVEYPVLAHYNPELKTEVHCDASAEGLAGMVLQMDEDGKWRLVYCVSKKTTEAEKMYHSSKLELMAIVWTLDRLRQFLVGIKFTVVTDCQALVYMNAKKTTNPQIARWYNLIQEYDFEIRHKPGEKMAHVDGMSRAPVDDPRDTIEEIVEKNLEVCLTITLEEQILMIQHSDPELRDLIQIFRKDPCDRTVGEQNRINDYSYKGGRLFRMVKNGEEERALYVIPKSMRKSLVVKFHDLMGHFATDRTVNKIKELYWFPSMKRHIDYHMSEGNEVLIAGDINIRIGNAGGFHNPLKLNSPLNKYRKSKDLISSKLSEKLISFTDSNSITIANGRTKGDTHGSFTFISERGSSVLDYFMYTHGLTQIISDMWIEELSYSDHLPIVLQINTGYEAIKSSYKNEILTRKFIWTKENVEMLKHNLSDIEVGNETDINTETANFTKQIYTAMESANIIKFAKRRHQLSKPWYDKDCYIMKKTTKVSLQRCRNSNNIHDRQKYIEARREYFKLLQRKRDEFNKDKNERIKNAKDPKSFWNAIASFRKKNNNTRQFEEFCRGNGIHHTLNSTKHPQGNGMVERVNRTVLSTIATSIEDPRRKDCDLKIKEVERDLNNAVNKTTNKTPFETLHGYSPRFHDGILRRLADEDVDPWTEPDRIQESVRTQIENKQEIMKTYYDKKKCRTIQFEVGEIVVMRHVPKMTGEPTKAQPKYRGPLIITEVLPSDTYRVTQLSERTSGRFYTTTAHISQLKSWHSEEDDSATEESPDEEPEVEDTPRRNPRRSCNARFNRGRLKSRNGRIRDRIRKKKMAENPNNRLQKFNGSKSAIRPESWIKLYDFENNSLKEDEKIKNLMYYLTDSALEWYADEIISNPAIKRWEVVKEKLIQRFGSYNANPIVSASHRRLKREESIENYFQDKIRLLNQTHLTKEEKIHLLTDGLPNDWKDLIVAAQPTDATKWFHIAASIEQNRASIQFKPKNKIHLATKNNDNRKNVCPFWCPICSKKGIKIKHWVTDCEDYDPNYKKDRPNQNTSVKQVCGAPELLNVSTLTNTPTQGAFKLINISVEVNGIPAQAFVDTGATVSIINWRLFKRTRLQLQPNSDIHISQADGVTRTCGSLQTKVRIDKLIKPVTLHVMKNFKYPLLIGLDVASLFNLLIDVRDKTIYTKIDGLQNPILVNHLEEIREHELKELLEHNRNVFSQHAIDLGKVAIQHKIITKSEQPISLRPYRRPLKEYEEIAEQVKELLEHKLIRTSDSPWAFPVVMVPKKDGNKRMCIDYRRLNEITLDDRQPLPHIQDMFDRLHGSRFFSTLDVAWRYWQIEMDPQSIQKTAFVTNDGHYEFLVMPFGLKNAASTFQRIIQHILGELLWKGTCSFQDDILVYTKTWQEHIELLSKVFDKLRQYNMKLKLSKCIFGRTEVKYLGHIISHNQLKPDPGKVKSIQDFPRPDTVKKVRQFMGLANYYRKFVKDFSKISFPLVRLTRKNQPFIWNEEVEESFAKLKMALSTKPVLAIYNPDYPSKVYTDASKYGIGAILTQIGPDNEEHVIAYYSKTLQPHQENYSAYEMECLAVIQATDHFHAYIENQPFEIITDHAALQWLFTMKKPKPKYFRWILSLSSKSCNIVHRSGKQQTHVDALSRLPVVNIATQELQEHQQNSDLSFLKNSHTHDGVVMIKQKGVFKAVVPNSLTKKILEEYHDSLSHPSITKTCKLITQCYWWKGITTDIKNYVRSCKSCQLVKVRHEPTLGEMITPTSNIQPLQMIGCDTIVLGTAASNTKHKFIQVFVDHATRYLWAYPTITNTAQAVTQCLDKIIKSVNSINTILTDNGKNFISKEFNKFLSLQGIKHTYTSPYHPQCNGICEKLNDTIMTKLRIAVLEKPRCKWSTLLPQVVKNYNSTPHDVTGFSPLFLMYGIGNVPEFADQTPITIEEARKKASLRTEQFR
ncbi:hypothetical protein LAZ67_15002575, partial [Cordylochernes scorpioides]